MIQTGASLRISTDEVNSDFISSALQIVPTVQHSKGEPRSKRNPKSSVFEESLWIYDSPLPNAAELHEHIENLLNLLELRHAALDSIWFGGWPRFNGTHSRFVTTIGKTADQPDS